MITLCRTSTTIAILEASDFDKVHRAASKFFPYAVKGPSSILWNRRDVPEDTAYGPAPLREKDDEVAHEITGTTGTHPNAAGFHPLRIAFAIIDRVCNSATQDSLL